MDHWKGSTRAAWLSMYTHLPVSQYLWSVSTPSSFSKNDPPPCAAALEGSTLHHSHKETEYEEQPHANIYGRTVWLIQTEKAIYAKLIQALLTQRAALQWWKKKPSLWWKSPYFHLKSILRDGNIIFWGTVKRWAHSPRVPFVKKKKKEIQGWSWAPSPEWSVDSHEWKATYHGRCILLCDGYFCGAELLSQLGFRETRQRSSSFRSIEMKWLHNSAPWSENHPWETSSCFSPHAFLCLL